MFVILLNALLNADMCIWFCWSGNDSQGQLVVQPWWLQSWCTQHQHHRHYDDGCRNKLRNGFCAIFIVNQSIWASLWIIPTFSVLVRGNALRQGSSWWGTRGLVVLVLVALCACAAALWLYRTSVDSDITETLASQRELISPQPRVYSVPCSEDYNNYKRYPGEGPAFLLRHKDMVRVGGGQIFYINLYCWIIVFASVLRGWMNKKQALRGKIS